MNDDSIIEWHSVYKYKWVRVRYARLIVASEY